MRPRMLFVSLLATIVACTDQLSTAPKTALPSFTIADAPRDYKAGFYWLSPMVKQPNATGTFDASLAPTVEICQLVDNACGDVIAVYTTTSGPDGEVVRLQDPHYQVNWHTNEFALNDASAYRISVRAGVDGTLLGYADVQPVANGAGLKTVDTDEFIGLVDGRTLPIKFRIETGVLGHIAVEPLEATLEPGGTQQYVANVTDLHGDPMTANVMWSSSDENVATVDQTGLATAVAPGTATITASAELLSSSATLTVEEPLVVSSIEITPQDVTLLTGRTQQYAAIVKDQHGNPMSVNVVWSSSDESAATIDQSGLATAISAGTAIISASVEAVSGNSTLTVEDPLVVSSIEVTPQRVTLQTGSTQQYVAIVRDQHGNPMSVSVIWNSSDESVAIVDQSGLATGVSPGTAIITAAVESVSGSSTLLIEAPPVEGIVLVSAGDSHSCAVDQAGVAFCWGLGSSGQLGNGFLINRLTPYPVAGGLTFTAIATAETHSCGITTTGQAYCWGLNNVGQLGNGTNVNQASPSLVAGDLSFTSIVAGAFHTCALTRIGTAYCWGFNSSGQLGTGTTGASRIPVLVSGRHLFTSLAAGRLHTCGLTSAGEQYCWGSNALGQLGDGTTTNKLVPTPVAGGLIFASMSAGDAHTCALTAAGDAYCWGNADQGRLGMGEPGALVHATPQRVAGDLAFTAISAGDSHTCAITAAGEAYCWGSNNSGRLGIGTTDPLSLVPAAVAGGLVFRSIDVGDHSCAVTTRNDVYCWGPGGSGRLGNGTTANQLAPTAIAPFPES